MRTPRPPLTSRSPRRPVPAAAAFASAPPAAQPLEAPPEQRRSGPSPVVWLLTACLLLLAGALAALLVTRAPGGPNLTLEAIDEALRQSLTEQPLPSQAALAFAAVAPSVVRVVGLLDDDDDGRSEAEKRALERSLGTGVVIVDNGTILTNLHVVASARRIMVRFADGSESEATLVGTQPQHDLAVLRARQIPDDLAAATMRSTADLRPGDRVLAVGHPFGIGESASAGVVSGLRREFRSSEGKRLLTNLIQFDAAANPGNSGGPLVTMDGHVVGIVTAIFNPGEQHTFIGIGFAVPIESAAAAAGMPPF